MSASRSLQKIVESTNYNNQQNNKLVIYLSKMLLGINNKFNSSFLIL